MRASNTLKKCLFTVLCGSLALSVMGCATIVNGSRQSIPITSQPAGATITVNGHNVGVTPEVLHLRRRRKAVLTIALKGYKTKTITLTRHISGWFWGNILIGGAIGMVVDVGTGAIYTFRPSKIHVAMGKVPPSKNDIKIGVTRFPSRGMKKIGHLIPL